MVINRVFVIIAFLLVMGGILILQGDYSLGLLMIFNAVVISKI